MLCCTDTHLIYYHHSILCYCATTVLTTTNKQVLSCLRYSTRVKNPYNYYSLLKALFKSLHLSNKHFDKSFAELQPLIPLVVSEISKLHDSLGPYEDITRSALVEIALTLPARIAVLTPHMPVLLRLMVPAIGVRSRGDINGVAFKTLDYWIDSLGAPFVYSILAQSPKTMTDLLNALCNNLRPHPFPYGTLALRILGKLGGRNRLFLAQPQAIPCAQEASASTSTNTDATHHNWHTTDCFLVRRH
jgi:transformation/transcription domain-associated protein